MGTNKLTVDLSIQILAELPFISLSITPAVKSNLNLRSSALRNMAGLPFYYQMVAG